MRVVFVFGSNLAGRHGKGAALVAAKNYCAAYGVGEGRTGMAYALPTKDEYLKARSLSEIGNSAQKFMQHARDNSDTVFQLTKVGCNLAGYTENQIKPLFAEAPSNVIKPKGW